MKKTRKVLLVVLSFVIFVLAVHMIMPNTEIALQKSNATSHVKAYNHSPSNILDNVFVKDEMTILPFIFQNSDQTVGKSYVTSEFTKAGLTIQNTLPNEIKTGTVIKTANTNYTVLIYGDVDGDGYVDVFDAQAILRHYVFGGTHELKGICKIAANVDNDDEEIDVFDAQKILRFYVGFETKLVLNEPVSMKESDTVKPVITLKGDHTVTVNLGSTYTDAGATAKDNVDGDITSKIKVTNNVNTSIVGTYTVTYTVTDNAGNKVTQVRTVKVVDYVEKIEIKAPTKTIYQYGEELDQTGMTVTAVMKSGAKTAVTGYTVTGYDKNTVGTQTITVTYQGKSQTFTVTVINEIEKIEITAPTKTTYKYGEEIDYAGMTITVTMKTGEETTVSANDCTMTGYDKNTVGTQTITVNYQGKSKTFTVTVNNYIKKIEITAVPTKTQYISGENIDTTGMVVEVVKADNTKEPIALSNITCDPDINIAFGTTQVEVSYVTSNTIDDTSKTFSASFDITVKKALGQLKVTQEQIQGYTYEQFTLGTIDSGADEESIFDKEIKYQVKDENGVNVTTSTVEGKKLVDVTFIEESTRPGEMQVKVKAQKPGKYKIVAYIDISVEQSVVANEVTIEIKNSPIIDKAKITDLTAQTLIRVGTVIEKEMTFVNIDGDELQDVEAGKISASGTDLDISLLTGTGNSKAPVSNDGDIVTGIRIKGTAAGSKTIKLVVNKGMDEEKTIQIVVTISPEARKTVDVDGTSEIKLYQEEPVTTVENVVVDGVGEDAIAYTLIPVKVVDEDGIETIIKCNDLNIGAPTENKPFGVSYTGHQSSDWPIIDVQMFKQDKTISIAGVDATYVGIAIAFGTEPEELEGLKLILKYGNSDTTEIDLSVEELSISTLTITPENLDDITDLPTIYNHVKTTIGTIQAEAGQKKLTASELLYKVENEQGTDVTNTIKDGKKLVGVTFEEESLRPDEIQIKVQAQEEGIYKIIPYVMVGSKQVSVEQTIEVVNDPVVTSVEIVDLTANVIRVGTVIEKEIIFKNTYGDILKVESSEVSASGTDLDISLLTGTGDSKAPVSNDGDIVTGIRIKGIVVGSKKINLLVNKGMTEETTKQIAVTISSEAVKHLDVDSITSLRLYHEDEVGSLPAQGVIKTEDDYGDTVIYSLVPISIIDDDGIITAIKGNEFILGSSTQDKPFGVSYTDSNTEPYPTLDIQMFNEAGEITTAGNNAKYVGIALAFGMHGGDIDQKQVTLKYGTLTEATIDIYCNVSY